MKYKNAHDILPDKLLKELQQYISGGVLYIPDVEEKKSWGEISGARQYYQKRNMEIREAYDTGDAVESLADKYNLTVEAVRKILYK